MGWLIAFGVLALLAVLPIGIRVVYNTHGLTAVAYAGPVRIPIYPRGKTAGQKKENKKENKKPDAEVSTVKKQESTGGGSLKDFYPLWDPIRMFLSDFRRKLVVDRFYAQLILAGEDPATVAENYGRAWSVLGGLIPQLENCFRIRDRKIEVECDFLADTVKFYGKLQLHITLFDLLVLALHRGLRILSVLNSISNKRKGGISQ